MRLNNSIPTRALFLCTLAVAGSTAALPWVQGYGTKLGQVVVLGAWGLLAAVTSGRYADLHHGPLWALALLLNLVLFLILAGPWWFLTRRRFPRASVVILVVWCVFYLSSLFYLFPATDGP
jgi:hypothetical protein